MADEFILRRIPEDLHEEWTIFSNLRGMTMRAYILLSLKSKIEEDKDRLGRDIKKEESKNGDG